MLHQVGVSFDLYYDARKHKIKIYDYINTHHYHHQQQQQQQQHAGRSEGYGLFQLQQTVP